MARAGGIKAGRAYVELHADDSKLVRGLRRAQATMSNFGDSMLRIGGRLAAIGGAVGGALLGAARHFTLTGDELEKLNRRTGISVESLSKMKMAAQLSGTSLGDLERALRRQQRFLGYLERGMASAVDVMDRLGLSTEELMALDAEGRFEAIAVALSRVEDMGLRSAYAQEIFGRSATQMLPLMEDYEGLMENLSTFEIPETNAKRARDLRDAFTMLVSMAKNAVFWIGNALADSLMEAAGAAFAVMETIRDWIKENQKLFRFLLAGVAVTLSLAGGFIALGVGAKLVAFVLGGLASVAGIVITVFGVLFSWVGAVALALVGLGLVIHRTRDIWFDFMRGMFDAVRTVAARVVRPMIDAFQTIYDGIRAYIGGVVSMIRAGDIEGAMRVSMLAVRVALSEATLGMRNIWADFVSVIAASWDWLSAHLDQGWAGVGLMFSSIVDGMKIVWLQFSDMIVTALMRPLQWVYDQLNRLMQSIPEAAAPEWMRQAFDVDLTEWSSDVDKMISDIREMGEERKKAFEEKTGVELADWDELAGKYAHALREGNKEAAKSLRKEYEEALKEAAKKGVESGVFAQSLSDIMDDFGIDFGAGMQRQAMVSFSPFAMGRDPGVQVQERIEKNTKDTNNAVKENTEETRRVTSAIENLNTGIQIT